MQAHHILSEVVQGGIVLETNVDEIQAAGKIASYPPREQR